jgi:hypothetical protein
MMVESLTHAEAPRQFDETHPETKRRPAGFGAAAIAAWHGV